MNLQHLRAFVAVVDTGSFTGAARRLNVAQPSLSQAVRTLEAELGGDLLVRSPRAVALTPAGAAFEPKARAAVQAAEDAAHLARRAMRDAPASLCLACAPDLPEAPIARAVAAWRAEDPRRSLRWHAMPSVARVHEKVRDSPPGIVGVGPAPRGAWDGPLVPLGEEPLVLALPLGAEPEDVPVVRPWRLGDVPAPDTVLDAPSERAALELVAAGAGTAVLPERLVAGRDDVDAQPLGERRTLAAFAAAPWDDTTAALVAGLAAQLGALVLP